MKMKNRDYFRLLMGIAIGLPFILLMSNCKKTTDLLSQAQHGRFKSMVRWGRTVHVVWSSIPDSNSVRINRATHDGTIGEVILDYNSAGWTSDTIYMRVPNQTLWLAGSGSSPGHLIAKTGGFKPAGSTFIRVKASGCIINGYSNGVDTTQGRATIEMFKSSYTLANGYDTTGDRTAIHGGGDLGKIMGVIVKNSGGDGIYIGSGHNDTVKDVIVDGANRNGISIIRGTNTTVMNSTFKNTAGSAALGTSKGPWAGMDIEPNVPTDTLSNIVISSCVFANNLGRNIVVTLKNVTASTTPATVYFYGCTTAGGSKDGVEIANLRSTGPASGEVYFQKCHFNYPAWSGIYIQDWCAGKVLIDFNKCTVYNAGASSNSTPPIYIYGSGGSNALYTVGHVNFEGVTNRVDDFNVNHAYIIGGTSAQGYDAITSLAADFTVQRHYTKTDTTIVKFTPGSGYTNTNMRFTYTLVPWP